MIRFKAQCKHAGGRQALTCMVGCWEHAAPDTLSCWEHSLIASCMPPRQSLVPQVPSGSAFSLRLGPCIAVPLRCSHWLHMAGTLHCDVCTHSRGVAAGAFMLSARTVVARRWVQGAVHAA
jgi:hypothetical protein